MLQSALADSIIWGLTESQATAVTESEWPEIAKDQLKFRILLQLLTKGRVKLKSCVSLFTTAYVWNLKFDRFVKKKFHRKSVIFQIPDIGRSKSD